MHMADDLATQVDADIVTWLQLAKDEAGHDFHGNQWTGGRGGGGRAPRMPKQDNGKIVGNEFHPTAPEPTRESDPGRWENPTHSQHVQWVNEGAKGDSPTTQTLVSEHQGANAIGLSRNADAYVRAGDHNLAAHEYGDADHYLASPDAGKSSDALNSAADFHAAAMLGQGGLDTAARAGGINARNVETVGKSEDSIPEDSIPELVTDEAGLIEKADESEFIEATTEENINTLTIDAINKEVTANELLETGDITKAVEVLRDVAENYDILAMTYGEQGDAENFTKSINESLRIRDKALDANSGSVSFEADLGIEIPVLENDAVLPNVVTESEVEPEILEVVVSDEVEKTATDVIEIFEVDEDPAIILEKGDSEDHLLETREIIAETVEKALNEFSELLKGGEGSGEGAGHPFRGNRYTSAAGEADKHESREGTSGFTHGQHLASAQAHLTAARAALNVGHFNEAANHYDEAAFHASQAAHQLQGGNYPYTNPRIGEQAAGLYEAAHAAGNASRDASIANNRYIKQSASGMSDPLTLSALRGDAQSASALAQANGSTAESVNSALQTARQNAGDPALAA